MDELKPILDMLREYGAGGALAVIVGAMIYGIKMFHDITRNLSINPRLSEHLITQEKLLTEIRDSLREHNGQVGQGLKRLEDIWDKVNR